MRIITDFDGPIMDLSDRYYHVYQLCLAQVKSPDRSINLLTKSEFWAQKRALVPEIQIGIESGLTPAQKYLNNCAIATPTNYNIYISIE
jgi:phosphoglycolate phosphatase-like HAD superfamily hydrolase